MAPQENALNVRYVPRSQGRTPGTLIPTNMAVSAQMALDAFEKERGNIDEFVRDRLGFDTNDQLYSVLYAEQIDSLALAFNQRDQDKIFLNGDQTGNGKGRFGAANIVDAMRQGYIPVFVTQQPNLYNSMLVDLADIGYRDLKPFMTNNDLLMQLDDGRKLRTGHQSEQNQEMNQIVQDGLGGYDAVFTTYTQLQTVRKVEPTRRAFLREIAPNSVFIFDEAHNAGGSTSDTGWGKSGPPDRSDFVRELVDASAGSVFMSATATKDPAVMDLYARGTDAVHAVASMWNLENTLKAGGIPLQQMMATKFVAAGNLLRRERSFDNITFEAKVVPVDRTIADGMSEIMRAIDTFDQEKRGALAELKKECRKDAKQASEDNSIGQAGARSTNFTSLMHNAIDQGLLSQKADATVEQAIAALERGEKPLIAVANTMDAFIATYAEDQGLNAGDPTQISFTDILDRYLQRSRDVTLSDYNGRKTRRPMTAEELGPAIFAYRDAQDLIANTDLSAIPLSSIDYIKHRLNEAGYRCDEITGRRNTLDYQPDGSISLGLRSRRETSAQGKINIVNKFNNGDLDVIILNRSGATGINLHASERFKDQRPRHMIMVQAERDINQVMQMLGRANRFGQVVEPSFTLLMGDVPAERRLGALLAKKMASLNANISADRQSDLSISNVSDFMNAAGEEVVTELLEANPELDAQLSHPTHNVQGGSETELISKVTGRIPLLPIKQQETLYNLIETETQSLIEQKEAMGENVLEADKMDLDARTIARMEVIPDEGSIKSEFTGPAHVEVVDAKMIDKPMTQLQVVNHVRETLAQPTINQLADHDFDLIEQVAKNAAADQLKAVEGAIAQYSVKVKARTTNPVALEKLDAHLDKQMAQLSGLLVRYPVGTPVQFSAGSGESVAILGVVSRVWQKNTFIGSPAAGTNWKMQILTANRSKQITIPFSKLNSGKSSAISMWPMKERWDGTPIYEVFDLKQRDQRVEMQLITGNLLSAYEKYSNGKFVNFTDSKGSVRQGLLMPESFDINEELRKEPVAFQEPHQVQAFLTEVTANQGIVHDLDRVLTILCHGKARFSEEPATAFTIQTAKATSVGGKYFLNEDLLAAAGNEFFSRGERMEMTIPAEKLKPVLQVIMKEQGVTLAAFDHKDLARQYLGTLLPTMETIEANQFEQQGDFVPYVPDPSPGMVDQLNALLDLDAPEREEPPIDIDAQSTEAADPTLPLPEQQGPVSELPDSFDEVEQKGQEPEPGEPQESEFKPISEIPEPLIDDPSSVEEPQVPTSEATENEATEPTNLPESEIAPQGLESKSTEPPEETVSELPEPQVVEPAAEAEPKIEEQQALSPADPPVNEPESSAEERPAAGIPETPAAEEPPELEKPVQQALNFELPDPNTTPQPEPQPESPVPQIAPPDQQQGAAVHVSKLLHEGGIAASVLEGDDYHLNVPNGSYTPLVIERHDQQLYMTHYLEQNGDHFIDAEMVYQTNAQGQLKLTETATQDPIRGGELRGLMKPFANLFAKNLLRQGFAEAIPAAVLKQQQPDVQEEHQSPQEQATTHESQSSAEKTLPEQLSAWQEVVSALDLPSEYQMWVSDSVEAFSNVTEPHELPTQVQQSMAQDTSAHEQVVDQVRQWYKAAMVQGKSQPYRDRIQMLGEGLLRGYALPFQAKADMAQDLSQYHWKVFSAGIEEPIPFGLSAQVTANALAQGLSEQSVQRMLESSPPYQDVLGTHGELEAQGMSKKAFLKGLEMVPSQPEAMQQLNASVIKEASASLDLLCYGQPVGDRTISTGQVLIQETGGSLTVGSQVSGRKVEQKGEEISGESTFRDLQKFKATSIVANLQKQRAVVASKSSGIEL